MTKRLRIGGTALLAISLGVAAWWATSRSAQPLIEGKSASYWMKRLGQPGSDPMRVWSACNPQPIPFFAKALAERNGLVGAFYLRLWPHLPIAIQCRLSRPVDARVIRRNAASAFLRWANASNLHWEGTDGTAIPYLVRALQDDDAQVRRLAAGALWGAGYTHPELAPAVVSALALRVGQDPDARVRQAAARSLEREGEASRAAIPTLLVALKDSDEEVRYSAADALTSNAPELAKRAGADAARVPALARRLQTHPFAFGRQSAAQELSKLGVQAEPAVPALLSALNDPDGDVRESAAKALKVIDPEAAAMAGLR